MQIHSTGIISTLIVALLKAAFSSSVEGSSPSKYFQVNHRQSRKLLQS